MSIYHSSVTTPLREGLKQMLRDFGAKHSMTLTFNCPVAMPESIRALTRWRRRLVDRLYRRHFTEGRDRWTFLLLPEVQSLQLHFHGVFKIDESRLVYFLRLANSQWKRVAPYGEFYYKPIEPTRDDHERYYGYVTKYSGAHQVVHSSMLD